MSSNPATPSQRSLRLSAIAERIGVAVWQLQELESVSAKYLVLVTQLKSGMDSVEHKAIVDKALSRPFGATLRDISSAKLFQPDLQSRFDSLLGDRNLLVHKSRKDCRSAIHQDAAALQLINRVLGISAMAMALMHEIDALTDKFALDNGLSLESINQQAASLMHEWQTGDAA